MIVREIVSAERLLGEATLGVAVTEETIESGELSSFSATVCGSKGFISVRTPKGANSWAVEVTSVVRLLDVLERAGIRGLKRRWPVLDGTVIVAAVQREEVTMNLAVITPEPSPAVSIIESLFEGPIERLRVRSESGNW